MLEIPIKLLPLTLSILTAIRIGTKMPVLNCIKKVAALNVMHYILSHDYRSNILVIFSKTDIFKNIVSKRFVNNLL